MCGHDCPFDLETLWPDATEREGGIDAKGPFGDDDDDEDASWRSNPSLCTLTSVTGIFEMMLVMRIGTALSKHTLRSCDWMVVAKVSTEKSQLTTFRRKPLGEPSNESDPSERSKLLE